jgi:ABC-type amino acid transport substrate-binding protein
VTLNEPNQLVYGYLKPWWQGEYRMPPGLAPGAGVEEMLSSVRLVMRNLFLANARARVAIKAARPDAMVGTNAFLLGVPGWLQRFLDWRAARLRSEGAWDASGRRTARPRGAAAGRVDLVAAALSTTAQRGREIDFSRPYRVAALRLLVAAGSAVTSAAQVRGEAVAVVRGSTAESAAPRLLPGTAVQAVASYDAGLAELASGRVAALFGDDAILEGLAARDAGRWTVTGEPLQPQRYSVGVAKGDSALLQVVDDAIAGAPPAVPERGLERVRRRGRLVAGVRADVPGLGFHDPATGRWSGQEIDLARSVAARIFGDPDRVAFEPVTTRDRLPALSSWRRVLDPLRRWIDLLLCTLDSNWWLLGMKGRLPEWLCPKECAGQQDYVGVDYYWGIPDLAPHQLGRLQGAIAGDYMHAPVWPGAMRRVLKYAARLFPGMPVMVVENGCVTAASGVDRATYLREHVREALRARAEGVPLAGYLCWSITSNREWGLHFGPANDFGLYQVELDTDPALRRLPTPATSAFAELVSGSDENAHEHGTGVT